MSGGDRDLRLCFIGDSFVAGHGDSTALGWVGRVTAAALRDGVPLTAYNLGVRGDTSVQVAQRLAAEVGPRLEAATDPRIVVSFGANDTVVRDGRTRTTTHETLSALDDICAAAGAARLLVVGPPAVDDPVQNTRLEDLDLALEDRAAKSGVAFISSFEVTARSDVWVRQVHEGDGFHPDSAGYEILAEALRSPIVDWLRDRST